MSNISPQMQALNKGPWSSLENKVRSLTDKGEVHVFTGPYYTEKQMCELPNAKIPHKIPNGYWKIIILKESVNAVQVRYASFKFEQETPSGVNICDYQTDIPEIERLSHYGFQIDKDLPSLARDLGC